MTQRIPATAAMLVKNSERYLAEVLTALADFDEVLLLDNGSTDRTFDIAAQFANVSYYKHDFIGFGPMKNLAARLAQNDWIFSIDSDEVADSELIETVRAAVAENQPQAVYSLSRLNHYHGRLIKSCGWYPDIIPRLYHRGFTRFSDRQVHEALVLPSETVKQRLGGFLKHYSFDNAEGLIQKMQQYSTLYAEENRYKKAASPCKALLHGGVSFAKNYLLKRGFADGSDGLTISVANAQGSYYKYIKLYERNRELTVSLIITTYNRPDALDLVLKSALAQTRLPDEIIIADDGSTQETAEVVDFIKRRTGVPIKHTWRPDDGFRAAEARNRALAAASCDYIIMIDGDMLLDPSFVADHIKMALKGRLIQGSRVMLTPQRTQDILDAGELPRLSVFDSGIEKRASTLRCRCLSALVGHKGSQNHKGIKTCNMGFFRADALAVNGFDNEFVGWGREDSEFVARCYHNGMKRHNLKFAGIACHLYHRESERDALPQNDARLQGTLNTRKIRCDNGVDAFLPEA
ncbi:glycosyltransferase family 2 protein [Neisseria perflava]|uniref:glycosyltransferase family 2 protein n=1 Tax=Neisseria perflava TaxID=33053 RepID=UPI0020A10484|nr:glycosyltransferase [Neisseria perflava]MCP1659571.1 glycosyltransferase involved in cell wall biosynthesis [Neisseria perflava]MCP1772449.1 glycosyltransferase involved in cell wall biosynthesis [Neisseria perflava]